MSDDIKQVVIVIDKDGNEAVYIDGKYAGAVDYIIDLVELTGGLPVELEHRSVVWVGQHWPSLLCDFGEELQ